MKSCALAEVNVHSTKTHPYCNRGLDVSLIRGQHFFRGGMYMRVDLKVLALQYEGDDHLVPSMIPRESSAMDFAKVIFFRESFSCIT